MKHIINYTLLLIFIGVHCVRSQDQESRELIKMELQFGSESIDKEVVVRNIHGSISVEGYDGDIVVLEVEKIIRAKNLNDLELGKKKRSGCQNYAGIK